MYFSKGPEDDQIDSLADHTIISCLVDPDGRFVEYYVKTCGEQEMHARIARKMDTFFPKS